jgi:hypothetical protein
MITTFSELEAVRRAGFANVELIDGVAYVFGCDYLVAARATRRGHIWEVTNMEAQEEIGGTFSSALAAVRYALSQGPIA